MLVISRNSTFVYKDKAVDFKQEGKELGVKYVFEDSVRKAGTRIRAYNLHYVYQSDLYSDGYFSEM